MIQKITEKITKPVPATIINVVLFIFLIIAIANVRQTKAEVPQKANRVVELISNENINGKTLTLTGTVKSSQSIDLLLEAGGQIKSILKGEGSAVKAGDTILILENEDESLAVANAKTTLATADTNLNELLNNRNSQNSDFKDLETQQNTIVEQARDNLLNNDLKAYPLDPKDDEVSEAPIIEGYYNLGEIGQYELEVYQSSTSSGASFRYKGLETGIQPVTVNQSIPLGQSGLYIRFNSDFDKTADWVIPIPNTRSSSYGTVSKAYEQAKAAREVALNSADSDDFQIKRAQAAVESAQISLRQAENNLRKTYLIAPVSGTITSLDRVVGEYVSFGEVLGSLKNLNESEVVVYVSDNIVNKLSSSQSATVNGINANIVSIGKDIDPVTNKVKVKLIPSENITLIGDSVDVRILLNEEVNQSELRLPLSALQVIGTDYYIFIYEDGIAKKQKVSLKELSGTEAIINLDSNLQKDIIKDTRGLKDNQAVTLN